MSLSNPQKTTLHVGVVGGGIGGLTAAIALRRAGAQVTVLEAATELGEIGAGIQMFGNVSRFLVRCGIDEIIGENLIQTEEVRNWTGVVPDHNGGSGGGKEGEGDVDLLGTGKLIGKMLTKDIIKQQGFPWWVVRRDHLHAGLAESARRHGAELVINARVAALDADADGVTVRIERGVTYRFDLVVGADGINSTVRRKILPHLEPRAASKIAAYRSVVPYEEVYEKIPEARSIIGNTMDSWSGPGGYVLLYPLTACKELNVVTACQQDHYVRTLEHPSVEEFQEQYKDFPPFIKKILGLVKSTSRWPLLVVPPSKTWSNEHKNIVLMGDAIHGMQNHMAQGAATSMEDGIFLGRIISEVLRNTIPLDIGISLYEKKRIPRCWVKQQSAFTQGEMWGCYGDDKRSRDQSTFAEVQAWSKNPGYPFIPPTYRTTMLFQSPQTVPHILFYDAEGDADFAVCEYLTNQGQMDEKTLCNKNLTDKWWSAIWDNGVQRWQGPNPRNAKL